MGVRHLNKLIKMFAPFSKAKVPLSTFANQTVAVDASLYIYQYAYGQKNPIDGVFLMANKLKKNGIRPVFVFDGKSPIEKKATILIRRNEQQKIKSRIEELEQQRRMFSTDTSVIDEELNQLKRKVVDIDRQMLDKVRQLLEHMGIPCLQAEGEAEHLCAKLCRTGLVGAVMSDDMDVIACGSPIVLREFSAYHDQVEMNQYSKVLESMKITNETLTDLCVLLGNDYAPRISRWSEEQLYWLLQEYKTIDEALIHGPLKLPTAHPYERIRSIWQLKTVYVDFAEYMKITQTKVNPSALCDFMVNHSSLDRSVYISRIQWMV